MQYNPKVLKAILRHAFQNMSVDALPVTTFELSCEATEEPSENRKWHKVRLFFDDMIQALK